VKESEQGMAREIKVPRKTNEMEREEEGKELNV
jgi:hypothetical protein